VQVRLGVPAFAIDLTVAMTGAALVVMATHGRTGLRRSIMGSVAGQVLERGSVPLVLVRPSVLLAEGARGNERQHPRDTIAVSRR